MLTMARAKAWMGVRGAPAIRQYRFDPFFPITSRTSPFLPRNYMLLAEGRRLCSCIRRCLSSSGTFAVAR
jgi:hypothetical protein